MSAGFTAEGGIDIGVTVDQVRIVDVRITNSRPLGLASHLAGLRPMAAVNRLVSLFSVCRMAQGLAAVTAFEQALGFDPGPLQRAARSLLLRGETALDHATGALLVWPGLVGKRPAAFQALKTLRASLANLSECLYPNGDWMRVGGGTLAPDRTTLMARLDVAEAAIQDGGLGMPLCPGLWRNWARDAPGPAADLLRLLEQNHWEGFGATGVQLLRTMDPTALELRLAADINGSFVAQPELEGEPRETGPLARQLYDPLISAIINQCGCGVAARFAAQCVETTTCLREMRDLGEIIRCDRSSPIAVRDGVGVGLVEAARGSLVHRVEVANGQVRRYQILAPTEWNFHPCGVLAQGLIESGAWRPNERLARLLVAALDPCVPYRIELH